MSLLTPTQFLEKLTADKVATEKAALDYEQLIAQNDALAGKIIAELSQTESDLDTLQRFSDLIHSLPKETTQHINALLGFTVAGNLATIKAHVTSAKNSIQSKG